MDKTAFNFLIAKAAHDSFELHFTLEIYYGIPSLYLVTHTGPAYLLRFIYPMAARDRSRSRSPTRAKKSSGLKWKQKKPATQTNDPADRRERDYRDENRRPDRRDPRDRNDEFDRKPKREDTVGARQERGVSDDADTTKMPATAPPAANSIAAKFGAAGARYTASNKPAGDAAAASAGSSQLPASNSTAPTSTTTSTTAIPRPSNEEMIIVNINDRLGTKAAIPCLASDPVKMFKVMVAARIGRQPHEILIKRQGERPFKDILTLADYGVSNGVQLDLELDTGD